MKRIVLWGCLLFVSRVQAQEILACYDKTVNIIFPYAIVSEDHGSNGIIVQQRKSAAHILHVKANQKNFAPTSLSVVTSDGRLYSFVVRYAGDVSQLNYIIDPAEAITETEIPHNERSLGLQCAHVVSAAGNVHRKSRDDFSILQLRGLYVSRHALWLKSQFVSRTTIPFPIGFIKFFIRSRRHAKNTAVQEREIFPVYQKLPRKVEGNTVQLLVFAFDPFVINAHEQLVMQVGGVNGNRMMQVRITPRHFNKMVSIDE